MEQSKARTDTLQIIISAEIRKLLGEEKSLKVVRAMIVAFDAKLAEFGIEVTAERSFVAESDGAE